VPKTTLNSTFL